MQRSKSYALMFLLGAFLAGGALGFTADRVMSRDEPCARDGRRSGGGLDRMSRELNLTAAQRVHFDSTMSRRRVQMRELFKPLRPQMDSLSKIGKVIGDSTHEQLKRVLTPEQAKKFDEMRERGRREYEARRRNGSAKDRSPRIP
ncbi:MAG TPA: hypothetical protein VM939_02335 [Gemmatimonadaceae bacterium]|nr:hypothetical protein [Gemmatimonadaceae bacterium]